MAAPAGLGTGGSRVPGIDGLRGLAAAAVLVSHVWLYADPTGARPDLGLVSRFLIPHVEVGLTLFFTLSGYLLWRGHARAILVGERRDDLRRYWRSRALRILPAYWVILLVVGLVVPAALVPGPAGVGVLGWLGSEPGALTAALLLVHTLHPDTMLAGIGPAWSLVVEVGFYAAVPVLAALVWRSGASRRSPRGRLLLALAPAGALLVLGSIGGLLLALVEPTGPSPGWDQTWYSVLARSFLVHADLFAPGMVVAVAGAVLERTGMVLARRVAGVLLAAAVAGALAVAALDQVDLVGRSLYDLGMAVACAALIAAVGLPRAEGSVLWLTRLLERRVFAVVGVASYSVYLWHEPVIRWLAGRAWTLPGSSGFLPNLLLVVVVTGVLSTATYLAVERPAMRRVDRRPRRGPAEAATPESGGSSDAG